MIARFFIDRPIFATVLSLLITLIGGVAMFSLPVAQYPRITPPGVAVSISYPGASAQVVADTVAAPIEQQVTGVPGMLYMSSQSGNDGTYTLTVTFDVGTDLKTAMVMVQNRVSLALPQLPTEVQNQGITIRKKTPDILMMVNLYSPDNRYDAIYLSNYATIHVKDELLRVEGVSDITYQGQRDYSVRAWLDPQKMAAHSITAIDVARAVQQQNLDSPAGQIGRPPSLPGQAFQMPLDMLARLREPQQFGNIIVKASQSKTTPNAAAAAGAPAGGDGLPNPGSTVPGANPPSTTGGGNTSTSSSSGSTTSSSSASSTTTSGSTTTSDSTTTSTTSTTSTPTTDSTTIGSTGGGNTTGGATSPGGGNTGGGANTNGGTTAGNGSSTGSTGAIPGGMGDLSVATGATGSGILSAASLGRGPGQPSVALVHLRDLARIEMGAQNYNTSCTFDNQPAVGLMIYQLPSANALDAGDAVRAKMEELKTHFPAGLEYAIGYDTTPFIRESVFDVVNTLFQAVVLVGMVVLFFLQDWRAMVLPMIDVPVSLIGTFAVMAVLGFSLNNISLFGLVLAIGIVVDDAIVVLENIERLMAAGMDVRPATLQAMDEVTGPIVAVAVVLCAVFVPCAFVGGITGLFFRQFAITIAVSTVISAVNAITMTPSRAVLLFKKDAKTGHGHTREALPWWFFPIVGGLLAFWFGPELLAVALKRFGATPWHLSRSLTWSLFALGFVVGGVFGWWCIRYVNIVLGALFRGFNYCFDVMTGGYAWVVAKLLHVTPAVLVVYAGLLVLTWWVFQVAPTGFIPQQDQGRLIVSIQLPDSASLQRTEEIVNKVNRITLETRGVAHTVAFAGSSFLLGANSPNFASMFVVLGPFDERKKDPRMHDTEIMAALRKAWVKDVPDAVVTIYGASPIPGLGAAGGFKFVVEDTGDLGVTALQKQTDNVVQMLRKQPVKPDVLTANLKIIDGGDAKLRPKAVAYMKALSADARPLLQQALLENYSAETKKLLETTLAQLPKEVGKMVPGTNNVATQFRANTPQLYLDIDRSKAAALGVSLNDVNQTLDMLLGSLYVTSYNEFDRQWQVTLQAEGAFRDRREAIELFQVRNQGGQMVPLGALVRLKEVTGPISVTRYNLYRAATVNGNIQTGYSSGDTIKGISELTSQELPIAMKADWTELMYLQIRAGNTSFYVFLLSVLCVFLALAALYESWSLPLAVILVVPLCMLCSVVSVLWTKRDVNIFVQIGLIVLVGLACKNAILVVEYARQLHVEGKTCFAATCEASRLRLRPILMTSFAFIFGVIPLMIADGAGAEMRRSLGTAVFSGMLGVTLFGVFLTPVFFYVIQGVGETRLFSSAAVRLVGSILACLFLGVATGWLVAKIRSSSPGPAMFVSTAAYILMALLARVAHFSIIKRSGVSLGARFPASRAFFDPKKGEPKP